MVVRHLGTVYRLMKGALAQCLTDLEPSIRFICVSLSMKVTTTADRGDTRYVDRKERTPTVGFGAFGEHLWDD
uniref:Putative secreted peptide n=1 Tax=Anopheles braziliensis TaxID=58242 RepID=A0A2M3ZXG3_9DIPT